jgi:lipoate-protein ligase A
MNMAIDEVLTTGVLKGEYEVFLRFYRWQPASFSFGYFQRPETILSGHAWQESGFGFVRRRSGGKMVFHAEEWTFSTGAPLSLLKSLFPGNQTFLEVFQILLAPLLQGLKNAGLPVSFSREPAGRGKCAGIACYSAAAGHSIYLGEQKLVGAAGVEKCGVLSIHGSLPIAPVPFPHEIFNRRIEYEKLPIAWLGEHLSPEEIRCLPERIIQAFCSIFAVETRKTGLDDTELAAAEALARTKYADLDWPKNGAYS